MSDTPRTDSIPSKKPWSEEHVILYKDLCCKLERELASERKRAYEAISAGRQVADYNMELLTLLDNENKRADELEKGAKHSLPYVVQYMRQDDSDIWHDMASFDYQSAALKYADSCANETWKYRVIEAATERGIVKNG